MKSTNPEFEGRILRWTVLLGALVVALAISLLASPLTACAQTVSLAPDSLGNYVYFGGAANGADLVTYYASNTGTTGQYGINWVHLWAEYRDSGGNLVGTFKRNPTGEYDRIDTWWFPTGYGLNTTAYFDTTADNDGVTGIYGVPGDDQGDDPVDIGETYFAPSGAVSVTYWYVITNTLQNGSGILAEVDVTTPSCTLPL